MCAFLNLKMEINTLSNILESFQSYTKDPENYISVQEKHAEEIKNLTRKLYNFTKSKEKTKRKDPQVFNQLVLKNFDEEQVWQQIELQNNFVCNSLVGDISHLLARKKELTFPINEEKLTPKKKKDSKSSSDEEEEIKSKKTVSKRKENTLKKNVKPSVVDDQFFKLNEMENFLEKMEKHSQDKVDDDDDDEDLVDYFINDPDDNESRPRYNDFFDQPENGEKGTEGEDSDMEFDPEFEGSSNEFFDEEEEDEDDTNGLKRKESDAELDSESEKKNYKKVKFDVEEEPFRKNNKDLDWDVNSSARKNEDQTPSKFEARQERLNSWIDDLEREALTKKPWQLKGEIKGKLRPPNSLLEEYLEFDIGSKPPPVFTQKCTLKLEDIIIQRIKDKAWDDVVRKVKPVETEMEYKKKLVLDQEKSKLSLAQIYEQEYLKQLGSKTEDLLEKEEVEPKEHQEIRIMMNKLFSKLDALTNFHFTPKQAEPEIKIISNIPAITMEEVAPVGTSEAALLAPEEVKAKSKGDLLGKSERTSTDKKRERRKKKIKQKLKYKAEESKNKSNDKTNESKSDKLSQKLLQKITKSTTVTQLKENGDGKFIKSSNAFFSKLQDDTQSLAKKKGFEAKSKSVKNKLNSGKSKKHLT